MNDAVRGAAARTPPPEIIVISPGLLAKSATEKSRIRPPPGQGGACGGQRRWDGAAESVDESAGAWAASAWFSLITRPAITPP